MLNPQDPTGKISRVAYIVEAALEYFVSLLITSAYLTNILNELGFSTAAQGIISSIYSLAFLMEVVAVLAIRKRSGVKRMCTLLLLFDQLSFSVIYFTPFFDVPSGVRSAILVVMLFLGYALLYISTPFSAVWFMSNVPNETRGVFTAKKEIVSLLSGFLFTFVMGKMVDYYADKGDIRTSFIVCGITIICLTIPHLISCLLVKEAPAEPAPKTAFLENFRRSISCTLGQSSFRKVAVIGILYHCAIASNSYSGNYQRNALGFSMTFISILTLVNSVSRAVASIPIGRFADKHTWEKMLRYCYIIAALAYLINSFTVPANGSVTYTAYTLLFAIAMGGMNSGAFNIMFEYADKKNRTDAIAWNAAIGGISGFIASLLESFLVTYIEKNGNRFLGLSVYPQQVLYFISFLFFIALALYCYFCLRKQKKYA